MYAHSACIWVVVSECVRVAQVMYLIYCYGFGMCRRICTHSKICVQVTLSTIKTNGSISATATATMRMMMAAVAAAVLMAMHITSNRALIK